MTKKAATRKSPKRRTIFNQILDELSGPRELSISLIGVGKNSRCYVWEVLSEEKEVIAFVRYEELYGDFKWDTDNVYMNKERQKVEELCRNSIAEIILLGD